MNGDLCFIAKTPTFGHIRASTISSIRRMERGARAANSAQGVRGTCGHTLVDYVCRIQALFTLALLCKLQSDFYVLNFRGSEYF